MASPAIDSKPKLSSPFTSSASPDKRISTSQTLTGFKEILDVQSILHLPEDAVWGLRKQDLRAVFLQLQKYALNPYPINITSLASPASPTFPPPTTSLSPLLRLPLEIRQQIYTLLLPPPSPSPIIGPHPRQLQTPIHLTQPIAPALLLLNHQIRSEALPILYGSPSQTIHITVDYALWTHKSLRGNIILSSLLTSSVKHIHLTIHLGSEKRANRPGEAEARARVLEVKKGIKKVGKWLGGADVWTLKVSWREPQNTFVWTQKRDVLEGVRGLGARRVDVGEVNWGLDWNKGRKFRFEVGYLKTLERGHEAENGMKNREILE